MLTLCLGMAVSAMDEPVQRWGAVIPRPLEELPLLIDDVHGKRPAHPSGNESRAGPHRRLL